MKTIIAKLVGVVAGAVLLSPDLEAADVTLDGAGSYKLGARERYYSGGARQQGRYRNLGADYYHRAKIRMRWITNNSNRGSGSLSFELWAMPYYGADSGVVLMTKGYGRLPGKSYIDRATRKGYAVSLNRWRFPELNLWEYTPRGWVWRDALSFRRKNLL